jgi:hypothetical protein
MGNMTSLCLKPQKSEHPFRRSPFGIELGMLFHVPTNVEDNARPTSKILPSSKRRRFSKKLAMYPSDLYG